MSILAFSRTGYEGELITVEVDIRRGLPGVDIVGLPDGAVREAKERIRAAIRNSGFIFPQDRILINLAPAAMRKEGSSFDLPIAMAILQESGQALPPALEPTLVLGELELSGRVRPVSGVLSAVSRALGAGTRIFFVPQENLPEAASLEEGLPLGVSSLSECAQRFCQLREAWPPKADSFPIDYPTAPISAAIQSRRDTARLEAWRRGALDGFFSLGWQAELMRALCVAAAGGHHVLLAGPPGGGKTMAGSRFPLLLPDLQREEAVEVTRLHSLAGLLPAGSGLLSRPPYRAPHHSASQEGMVGGGKILKPGEISLAHRGVLFLDEAPEFDRDILQALREPIEAGWISLSRAGSQLRFPADFQLILAANPCPCGNLGRAATSCLCSLQEVERYWRRLGAALLDRIDIRVAVKPLPPERLLSGGSDSGPAACEAILGACQRQAQRYQGLGFRKNSKIPPEHIAVFCPLSPSGKSLLQSLGRGAGLSSRGSHSLLRLARTIADLDGKDAIGEGQLVEAFRLRGLEGVGEEILPNII